MNTRCPRSHQRHISQGKISRKNILQLLLPAALIAILAACSGGSSSDSTAATDPTSEAPPVDTTPADVTPPEVTPPVVAPDEPVTDEPGTPPVQPSNPVAGSNYDRPYDYPGMAIMPLEYFPTINGKQLGVRVTLPADENGNALPGPFPTVLVQTGYNMYLMSQLKIASGGPLLGMSDPYLVRHGYALVVVDVYGTGVSGGGWSLFGREEQAGYRDAVDWVKQQPWYDGNLGVAGVSYLAISALWTAEQKPDDIKAVFAASPIGDAQRGIVGTGGMFNAVFMSYWAVFTQSLSIENAIARMQNPQLVSMIDAATQDHIDNIDNFLVPLYNEAMDGNPAYTYSSDFWTSRSPLFDVDKIRAPTLVTGALQDIFQRDAPLWYEHLKQNNVETRLIIYNSDHIRNFFQSLVGNDVVDPFASLSLFWFDKYLKGMNLDVATIPPVTQYVKNLSANPWGGFVEASDWPHPQMSPQRWYLHGDLSIDTSVPVADEDTHVVDAAPAPGIAFGKSADGKKMTADITLNDGTRCSVSYRQWTLGIAGILASDGIAASDVCYNTNTELEKNALNFETAPMTDNYYINGPLEADIWVETTGENAILSVWIDEVTPEGESLPISNGLLLASARAVDESRSRVVDGEMIQPYFYFTQEQEIPVVPGEVFKMQVEIFPTSYLIRKGNRLRVSISSSNQAQGVLNYARQAQVDGSTMTIHNSDEYPSSIVLPAVPLSALKN